MAERVQKQKSTEKQEAAPQEEIEAKTDEEVAKLKAETDALLDEIDGLLETDAEAFVKGFVQKGGE